MLGVPGCSASFPSPGDPAVRRAHDDDIALRWHSMEELRNGSGKEGHGQNEANRGARVQPASVW